MANISVLLPWSKSPVRWTVQHTIRSSY